MATPDPRPDDYSAPDPGYPPPRYEQPPVVVERRSSGGLWAFVIVLLLLVVAGVLYFTGVFNGRPIVSEKDRTNIHINAPAAPAGGGGATAPGGQ